MTLATALVLSMACQAPLDRHDAEQLARSGQAIAALEAFSRIVAADPADHEARAWIGTLLLRLGRAPEAEAAFRTILRERPSDVDARIGLGAALTRQSRWPEALDVLLGVEPDAGNNADLFGALARAYRRGGDDRRALEYYRRAKALAPADRDVIDGFEATARAYGHSIALEGFAEAGPGEARSVSLDASLRIVPRLRLDGVARAHRQHGADDVMAGGGATWRVRGATNLTARVSWGPGNHSLPTGDIEVSAINYAGALEAGTSVRRLVFPGVRMIAVSPLLARDTGGRWRLETRYTYSRSSFEATGESSGDHSVLLRSAWRGWRRAGLSLAYAYGIESFENLTADRLESLGTNTLASGLQIRMPSLTHLNVTWEHQWRSNETTVDRVTVAIVQAIP